VSGVCGIPLRASAGGCWLVVLPVVAIVGLGVRIAWTRRDRS